MSEETARIARMWASMDPARPETLVTVIEHIRCSLSEGMCPMCAGPVVQKAGPETQGDVAFYCTVCPCKTPLVMAGDFDRNIRPDSMKARTIARLLQMIWETVHE